MINRASVDWHFIVSSAALFFLGVTALYSLSLVGSQGYFSRQLFFMVLGLAVVCLLSRVSMSGWRRVAKYGFWLSVVLLFATVLVGDSVKGAQRWLVVGGISLQPVEFFKVFLLLSVARWASVAVVANDLGMRLFFRMMMRLLLPLAVILLQPDFGSLALLLMTVLVILFLAGWRLIWVIIGGGLALGGLVWAAVSVPYRLQRLLSFVDPFADPYGQGYNQLHSLMGYKAGGLFGVGLGRSIEKYQHLPESHNDFIIAIIAEEWGIVGFFVVCSLFLFLTARIIGIACQAEARGELFGALYAFGLSALLFFQTLINIGGSLSVLPSKGFTLPLVSYGGSSLWATLLAFTVLLRLDWENRQAMRGRERYNYD